VSLAAANRGILAFAGVAGLIAASILNSRYMKRRKTE
jgi:hypothetical protein